MKRSYIFLLCLTMLFCAACIEKKYQYSVEAVKIELPFDEIIRRGNAAFVGEFQEAKQVSEVAFENRFIVKTDIAGNLKVSEVYVYSYFGILERDMDHFEKGKQYLLLAHYYEQIFREHTLFVLNYEMAPSEETGLFISNEQGIPAYTSNQQLFDHIRQVFWSVDRTEKELPEFIVLLRIDARLNEGDSDYNANTYAVQLEKIYTEDESLFPMEMAEAEQLYAVIEKGKAEPGKEYILSVEQVDGQGLLFIQTEPGRVYEKDSEEAKAFLKMKGWTQ